MWHQAEAVSGFSTLLPGRQRVSAQGLTQGSHELDSLLRPLHASVFLLCASVLVCQGGKELNCLWGLWECGYQRSQSLEAPGQDWACSDSAASVGPIVLWPFYSSLSLAAASLPLGSKPAPSPGGHRWLPGDLCKLTLPQDTALMAPTHSGSDVSRWSLQSRVGSWPWLAWEGAEILFSASHGTGSAGNSRVGCCCASLLVSLKELTHAFVGGHVSHACCWDLANPELLSLDLLKVTGTSAPWLLYRAVPGLEGSPTQ